MLARVGTGEPASRRPRSSREHADRGVCSWDSITVQFPRPSWTLTRRSHKSARVRSGRHPVLWVCVLAGTWIGSGPGHDKRAPNEAGCCFAVRDGRGDRSSRRDEYRHLLAQTRAPSRSISPAQDCRGAGFPRPFARPISSCPSTGQSRYLCPFPYAPRLRPPSATRMPGKRSPRRS